MPDGYLEHPQDLTKTKKAMKYLLLLLGCAMLIFYPTCSNASDWTSADQQAFKQSARVIEIFKLDLEFVQSLRRVMGRAPQYTNRNAKQAEQKVLSDIAASYYDALKSYSNNTTSFLTTLVRDLDNEDLSAVFQLDTAIWQFPIPQQAEYCWLQGITDLAAAGAGGAVAMGEMDDGLKMTAGAVAGANFVDFIRGIPGINTNVQEQTLDIVETQSGEIEQIGLYAKKIHDLSVKYAMSRLIVEDINIELTYYKHLVDKLDQSAQTISDLIAILNYGTNEAAYEAIQEMIAEGKKITHTSNELLTLAVRLGLKTQRYKLLPQTSLIPMLHVALDNLNQRIVLLQQRMQLHKEVFEVILDTSKNVEIVQFYLTNN